MITRAEATKICRDFVEDLKKESPGESGPTKRVTWAHLQQMLIEETIRRHGGEKK